MSENLTIDEILRQAEEIRKKTARKAEAAIDKIHATQTPLEPQPKEPTMTSAPGVDDKTRVTAPVTDKTQVRPVVDDKTRVGTPVIPAAPSATAKTTAVPSVGDKTRPVRLTEKTGVVPNLGGKRSFFGTTGSERVYSKEPPEIIEKPDTPEDVQRLLARMDKEMDAIPAARSKIRNKQRGRADPVERGELKKSCTAELSRLRKQKQTAYNMIEDNPKLKALLACELDAWVENDPYLSPREKQVLRNQQP